MATPFEFSMDPYKYEPIIHHEHAFRILRLFPGTGPAIMGEIIHASLEDTEVMEYEAVSYVWGNPELASSIDIQGMSLRITNNLELVLRDLRFPDQDRLLWIDAICIDQDKNDAEKSHQVRQMSEIYNRADAVVFHLGRPTELTPILSETLTALQERHRCDPAVSFENAWLNVSEELVQSFTEFNPRIRRSVESVLDLPWFKRVWIIQEVANARKALIHWGHATLPVNYFVSLVRQLGISIGSQQKAILDMMPRKRRSESSWASKQDLYDLLQRFAGSEAARDHDKIFALLAMCKDGKGQGTIQVDYSKPLDLVVRKVIAYMLFCPEDDVPLESCNMNALTGSIESLLDDIIVYLATNARLTSLRSLFDNRRDDIVLTETILRGIFAHGKPQKELDQQHYLAGAAGSETLRILLNHRPDKIFMTEGLLELAIPNIDHELIPLLMEHCPDNTAGMAHLLKISRAKDGSDDFRFFRRRTRIRYPNASEYFMFANPSDIRLTPLWRAVVDGNIRILRKLLDEGAEVNPKSPEGLSPLGWAVANGREDMVCTLLESHADTEAGFQTPLCMAVERGDMGIVKHLLHYGANIESLASMDRSALSLAPSDEGHAVPPPDRYAAEMMSMNKPIPRNFDPYMSDAALHPMTDFQITARSRKHIGVYQYDKDSHPGSEGIEFTKGYSDIIDLLLQKNADVDSEDHKGSAPLWWTANYGHLSVIEKLIQNNANVQAKRRQYMTLISWATRNGHNQMVQRSTEQYTNLYLVEHEVESFLLESLFTVIRSNSEYHARQLLDKCSHTTDNTPISLVAEALNLAIAEGCRAIEKLVFDVESRKDDYQRLIHSVPALPAKKTFVGPLLDNGADNSGYKNEHEHRRAIFKQAVEHLGHTIVRQWLEESADLVILDSISLEISLKTASRHSFVEIVAVILKNNAIIHASAPSNETILQHAAALRGNHEIIKLLLEYGNHFDPHKFAGTTALMITCLGRYMAAVEHLLASNVDTRVKDSEGPPAQNCATIEQNKDIMRVLENGMIATPPCQCSRLGVLVAKAKHAVSTPLTFMVALHLLDFISIILLLKCLSVIAHNLYSELQGTVK